MERMRRSTLWGILVIELIFLLLTWPMVPLHALLKSIIYVILALVLSLGLFEAFDKIQNKVKNEAISITLLAIILLTIPLFCNIRYWENKDRFLERIPDNGYIELHISRSYNMEYNHQVGNEWSKICLINDKVFNGEPIIVDARKPLTITTRCVEHDEYSDYGEESRTIDLTKYDLKNPIVLTQNVVVTENKGAYAGNTALWTANYVMERKASFWNVLANTSTLSSVNNSEEKNYYIGVIFFLFLFGAWFGSAAYFFLFIIPSLIWKNKHPDRPDPEAPFWPFYLLGIVLAFIYLKIT